MIQYTHLLLDLDGTLLDFQAAQRKAFFAAMRQLGVDADEAMLQRYEKINAAMWQKLERGEITRPRLLRERFVIFCGAEGLSLDADVVNEVYFQVLRQDGSRIDGAGELLNRLFGRVMMIAATNGNAGNQRARLERSGFARYFSALAISEEIGFEKPDPRFFAAALELAQNPDPAKVLVVGDSPTADVAGAAAAGLDCCWFNPGGLPESGVSAKYCISRLDQLDDIVFPACETAGASFGKEGIH